MKKPLWWLTIVGVIGAMGILLAHAQDNTGPTETRELREQVELLQKRVAALESRLSEVEAAQRKTAQQVHLPPQALSQPSGFLRPGQPGQRPHTRGEIEVNGWKFYLVPCENQ